MKFAFSTNAFRGRNVIDAIAAIAGAGYSGVEIMADVPHAFPRDLGEADIAAIRSALARHSMAVSNVNAFMMCAVGDFWHPSWVECDEGERRTRIEHTVGCIGLAAALGAKTISTEPGGPVQGMTEKEAMDLFERGLREVIPVASERGVKILVEPEPGLLIETAEEAETFLRRVNSEHVRINFDAGHFYCVGEEPAEAFKRLAPYVEHIHLEDIADDRRHYHLVPGEGAIDFEAFFRATEEAGYDGWMTVELYTYEEAPERAAREALDFLKRFRS